MNEVVFHDQWLIIKYFQLDLFFLAFLVNVIKILIMEYYDIFYFTGTTCLTVYKMMVTTTSPFPVFLLMSFTLLEMPSA